MEISNFKWNLIFIHLLDLYNQEQLQKNATIGPLAGIEPVAL
jgi:hypothetical protein